MGLESGPADSRSPYFPSPNSQALSLKKCPDVEIWSVTDYWPSRSFLLPYLPGMGLSSIWSIYNSVCLQNSDVTKEHLKNGWEPEAWDARDPTYCSASLDAEQ